jgi:hypothetical protein
MTANRARTADLRSPDHAGAGSIRFVAAETSTRFWQTLRAALACYGLPPVIRSIRAGRPEFIAVIAVMCGLFYAWASRSPRTASITFAYLALISALITIVVPSSEPVVVHLSLTCFCLAATYLGFRAHEAVR